MLLSWLKIRDWYNRLPRNLLTHIWICSRLWICRPIAKCCCGARIVTGQVHCVVVGAQFGDYGVGVTRGMVDGLFDGKRLRFMRPEVVIWVMKRLRMSAKMIELPSDDLLEGAGTEKYFFDA
ncbi:MAG: hypothetical protein V8T12_03625 [Parabacteroides johnsonii]